MVMKIFKQTEGEQIKKCQQRTYCFGAPIFKLIVAVESPNLFFALTKYSPPSSAVTWEISNEIKCWIPVVLQSHLYRPPVLISCPALLHRKSGAGSASRRTSKITLFPACLILGLSGNLGFVPVELKIKNPGRLIWKQFDETKEDSAWLTVAIAIHTNTIPCNLLLGILSIRLNSWSIIEPAKLCEYILLLIL